MLKTKVEKIGKDKPEKKRKKDGVEKKRKSKNEEDKNAEASSLSLLADEKAVDPTLSSLFAAKSMPIKPAPTLTTSKKTKISQDANRVLPSDQDQDQSESNADDLELPVLGHDQHVDHEPERKRKRKRKDEKDEIEEVYMRRLADEEAKEAEKAAAERAAKRQKAQPEPSSYAAVDEDDKDAVSEYSQEEVVDGDEDNLMSPPPQHETEQAADVEVAKANRTVFLGNVSTAAISSKKARRDLISHLKSFLDSISKPKDGDPKHSIESIRFRSTPYATKIPKKAAYATKQLMDATAKSSNAYAVYSSPALVREAVKHLNGTVILGRHLRVDEVAHPAKVDHRRCVFVGNLGFVDDESNIQAANEEEGKEKRKPSKQPADVEEGLWRTFGRCGHVESVRVIRDSTTRVGKGIAYVQFDDANAVEAALLYNEKKFPPMLPRKLRVSRAKAQKRNPKAGSDRPTSKPRANGYQRKISGEEASKIGRAGKLFGRAAAAKVNQPERSGRNDSNGFKALEAFVFEGHRASSKGGKAGLKLGGRGKKKPGKPAGRSAKRGAAFKAAKRTK